MLSDHHIFVLHALSDIAMKFFSPKLKVFACFKFSNIFEILINMVHFASDGICQIFKHMNHAE